MSNTPEKFKKAFQFIILGTAFTFTTGCNITVSGVESLEELSTSLPELSPEPNPSPELEAVSRVLDPISINQGNDDGYSWGKYDNSDWESDNLDNTLIRLGAAGNQDRNYVSSYMFSDVEIKPGQKIESAKIVFTAHSEDPGDSETIDLTIKAINPASQSSFAIGDLAQDRDALETEVRWNKSSSNWETPDLTDLIQAIVNNPEWDINKSMGFVIQNTSGATGNSRHNISSANSADIASRPKLLITYTEDLAAPAITKSSSTGTFSSIINDETISVNTDEAASCKFSEYTDTGYADMENSFISIDQTQHLANLSDLIQGNSYEFYVRCEDLAGNATSTDFTISFAMPSSS